MRPTTETIVDRCYGVDEALKRFGRKVFAKAVLRTGVRANIRILSLDSYI